MTPERRRQLAAEVAARAGSAIDHHPLAVPTVTVPTTKSNLNANSSGGKPPKPGGNKPKEKKPPFAPKKKTGWRKYQNARLPDKSMYLALYDAAKEQWNGSLIVSCPQDIIDAILVAMGKVEGRSPTFDAFKSGVMALLQQLDQFYRQSLPPSERIELPTKKNLDADAKAV